MERKIYDLIKCLIQHIDQIQNDLKDLSFEDFERSNLLIKATSFSLIQMGEILNDLEDELITKHPDLPWKKGKEIRNMLVNDFENTKALTIYLTATQDIEIIKNAFSNLIK